jgi:CBS domain containing-hemolysin-like protein
LDSGSTTIAILLVLAALVFLALRAIDATLPLLRRGTVRETLKEGTFRDTVLRRMRSSREAYDELVQLLTSLSAAGVAASSVALLARATDLSWPIIGLGVVGIAFVALTFGSLIERLVPRLSIPRLVLLGTAAQIALLPLLPLPRLVRLGLPMTSSRAESAPPSNGDAAAERPESKIDIEEEIGEEPLERHEEAMIYAILHLDETPVREIMVPRVDVVSLDVSASLDEAVPRMLESGHSRLPVYEEGSDNIIGILYSRDLLAATTRGHGAAPPALRELLRPCFFVPESKRVDEMLTEFQQRRVHLAVVVDEYGGVAGIVTIEDLLEEIVGEIEDEFDRQEPTVERSASGEAQVDARMPIDSFNEEFNVEIEPQGFDTLGGLLFSRLGRIPTAGDMVEEAGLRMQVTATAGRRIKKVRVSHQPIETPADREATKLA